MKQEEQLEFNFTTPKRAAQKKKAQMMAGEGDFDSIRGKTAAEVAKEKRKKKAKKKVRVRKK